MKLGNEVHESMTEHLSLDFAVDLVCLEGTDDEVIGVVGAYLEIIEIILLRTS